MLWVGRARAIQQRRACGHPQLSHTLGSCLRPGVDGATRWPSSKEGRHPMAFDQAFQEQLIRLCQEETEQAIAEGNPPFGALLVDPDRRVVVRAHNTQLSDNDPIAHAEINVLRAAGSLMRRGAFDGFVVVANAEPCSMCMSACIKVRIKSVYYGALHEAHLDPLLSAQEVVDRARHRVELHGGILSDECASQVARGRRRNVPVED